ncbi:hypothetical protein LguiA_015278 [Lonicera macranthoides]
MMKTPFGSMFKAIFDDKIIPDHIGMIGQVGKKIISAYSEKDAAFLIAEEEVKLTPDDVSVTFGLPKHGTDDTITATQFLTGDQTLVSSDGNFELGFFRLTVLLDGSQTLIWSTNVNPSSSNSILAVLRDDGNLVLIDGLTSNGSNSKPIWESFNHPTHTFFPGAKLGYNKLTKRKQMLTSWKNSEDPGMGLFSLEIDPDGNQYIIRFNGSQSFWSSGAWNGKIFRLVPEMRLNYIYNFSYIDNENETYFTYSLYNTTILSRLVMDISGQTKMFSWLDYPQQWNLFWSIPRGQCQAYAYCGAFSVCDENLSPYCNCLNGFMPRPGIVNDSSSGCVRKTSLECGNSGLASGKKDRFLMSSHMGLPEFPQFVEVRSEEECEANCLNNCSCTAYAYDKTSCLIWNGVLMNLIQLSANDVNGKVIHVRVSLSEFSSAKNGVIIGIVVGCVVGVLALLGLIWVVMRRRRMRLDGPVKGLEGSLMLFSEVVFFPTEAASVTTSEGDLINLLDHRLDNIADAEEVARICRVACWCVQDEENLRPTMGQVVQILEGVLDVKLPHMPQSLQIFADNQDEHALFFTELSLGHISHARVLPLST